MSTSEKKFEEIAEKLSKKKVEVSSMFGMPCYKIKSKAFAGLLDDAMVFKLTGDEHFRALSLPGSKLFDPAGGRPMKEWVKVSSKNAKHWEDLSEAALKYVSKK
jgi:hypothetical protein